MNLSPRGLPRRMRRGVYAVWVRHDGAVYRGALYFGPRLIFGEKQDVLEIHLIGFRGDVYGTYVSFLVGPFLRSPRNFTSQRALKVQVARDVRDVEKSLRG